MRDSPPTNEDFTDFVAASSTALYRSAWLLTTNRAAAEDLVQTALAKAFAHWGRVRGAEDPASYVHGIVYKTFLSDRRRRSSGEVALASMPESASEDPDPTVRLALMAGLRALRPLDRAVVVLRYWEDRSVEETARQLDLTPAAVKNRSIRSLRELRRTLTDHHDTANQEARS